VPEERIDNADVPGFSNGNIPGISGNAFKEKKSGNNVQQVKEKNPGYNCHAAKECPCMQDKPFLHVMAPGYAEDGSVATKMPWKQRYVGQYKKLDVQINI
jgi:hypothetical protein